MKKKLKNKVALITGAGAGIGRAIALLFAQEGARVAVNVYKNIDGGKETVRIIKDKGGDAFIVKADVSIAFEVREMINEVINTYNKLDILVNNSGIGTSKSPDTVIDISEDDWDRVIDVNLKGVMLTSKYAIPEMIKQGEGSIVNISSIRGLLGNPNLASYCASKGGMVLLSKEMALDYAKYNIRVNCICPGFIDTGMFRNYLKKQKNPDRARKIFSEMSPMSRIGKPEEIASVAVFFASKASSFITGVSLPVDGGYIAYGVRRIL